jgi:ribosomal protein S18 acetylase RimI-like enzyme
MRFDFSHGNEVVGYIDYVFIEPDEVFIKHLYIYETHRGGELSKRMVESFRERLPYKLSLIAMEDMERYDRLFRLYRSMGFKDAGKESICCQSDRSYRKKRFVWSPPTVSWPSSA